MEDILSEKCLRLSAVALQVAVPINTEMKQLVSQISINQAAFGKVPLRSLGSLSSFDEGVCVYLQVLCALGRRKEGLFIPKII